MQSQIDALTTLVAELSGRITAAEQLSGSPPSPLVTAVTAHTTTLSGYGTRLSAAENLNGVASPLTNTVKQVRDLTTGTPLYTAVHGMRTLVAGTALTDAVLAIRDFTPTAFLGYTTLNGIKSIAAGQPITDALIGMRDMSVTTTTLVSTLLAVRDLTSGTPLYSAVNNMRTLVAGTTLTDTLIALRDVTPTAYASYTTLNGLKSLTPGTTLTDAVLAQGTRISAAENLNGVPTTLTDTVKQVRDLTAGTPLFTAVDNMRTLVAGSNLTDTLLALRDGTGNSALVTSVHNLQNHSACCGTTPPGSSAWTAYGGSGATNSVEVSLASCGFTSVPFVVTSLTGANQHAWSIGQTSVYYLSATGFRVYVTSLEPPAAGSINTTPMAPAQCNTLNWAITWCAFV
jgi:hypothetical protein